MNEIKRKNFQMKILDVGKKANTQIELNEAKNQGLESLIEIPDDVKNKVNKYLTKIIAEQNFFKRI